MDESPEPTMIARTLKDFNQFISSGMKAREPTLGLSGSSRLRLNFSDAASDCSSLDDSRIVMQNPRKRPLDTLTGLDVSKRFREKNTELADAKATITMLNGRLQNVEVANKKASLTSETQLESLKRKQMRDKELIDDLQHKVKRLQTLHEQIQAENRRVRQTCNDATHKAQLGMLSSQQEYMDQNSRLQEEVAFLHEKVQELENDLEEKALEADNTQCHADEVMQQLSSCQRKLRESTTNQAEVENLQLQLEQKIAKIKDLELQRDELAELEKKNQVFEATVSRLHVLEKENTKLKEENIFLKDTAINTRLLEEKVVNAKQQVMALETRCKDLANAQAMAELYKNNLKQFEDGIMEELNLSQKPTVAELKNHISKLKKQDQELAHGVDEILSSQKSLESGRMCEKNENKTLRSQIQKQQTVTQQNTQIIKRLQRKLLLLTQERDSLKNILSTYEAELTINFSTVSQERIDKLESQLESYREELKLMEEELEEAYKCAVGGTESPRRRERGQRTLALEKKVQGLEEEVARLMEANEVLEGRIENLTLKGDYDPTTTKVLHFKNNPLSTAIENRELEIETLQTENEALRERVRLLEEGEQLDLTQKVGMKIATEGHSSKDVLELQEKLSNMETRNKRLLEVFKKKAQEMREVIFLINGYRIDSTSEIHYKLSNLYAESAEDFFMFEYRPDGTVQLLETPFSIAMGDLVDVYLRGKKSLPAFISAVTLELFNRHQSNRTEDEMDDEELEDMDEDGEQRSPMSLPLRKDSPGPDEEDDEEEEEEEEEEEMDEEEDELDEEEEEEHYNEDDDEGEEDDGDDLICLD